jgi:hypothetical protein
MLIRGSGRLAQALGLAMRSFGALMVGAIFLTSCSSSPKTQKADLAFWFRCDSVATPALEEKIDAFLKSNGFRVLNLGAIQRQRNVAIYDLSITAIDDRRRIIDMYAFRSSPGSQAVAFYSSPPTQHDLSFEQSLLTFATQNGACRTDQVTRGENGAEIKEMHDQNVNRIEGLFKEANELGVSGAKR